MCLNSHDCSPPSMETPHSHQDISNMAHRIENLTNCLKPTVSGIAPESAAAPASGASSAPSSACSPYSAKALNVFLDKHNLDTRAEMFDLLKDPLFTPLAYNLSLSDNRALTVKRLLRLCENGYASLMLNPSLPKDKELELYARSDALYYYDQSLINLFGGSIKNLGTDHHHKKYIADVASFRLPGCFAMTELGHGSNVKGLETTATYDKVTKEFIINTPAETAQKFWIGNGLTAHMASVFAQLHIEGVNRGIHVFLVPLRDSNGKIPSNIRIADCGVKMGLNGVDNARLWFNNVRIPRENLLNRFANVTEDGEYESLIEDNDMRFGAMVAELVSGRVSMIGGSAQISKVGLAIAILYALSRRQFGPESGPEIPIMDYLLHQRRLVPELAAVYAMNSTAHVVRSMWVNRSPDFEQRIREMKEIHILSSGLKAVSGWQMRNALAVCREACGGQGYAAWNRIPVLMADSDVFLTFEGDNSVLLVQVARQLVKEYTRALKQGQHGSLVFSKSTDRLAHMAGTSRGVPLTKALPVVWDAVSQAFVEVPLTQYDGGKKWRNAEYLLRVFEIREYDTLKRLVGALAVKKHQGLSDDAAWNACGDLAASCGQAYIERFVLVHFTEDVQKVATPERALLEKLRALHALWRITTQASFLAYQYIPVSEIEHLTSEVNELLAELRPHLRVLVEGFGIPNHLLAPIAIDYVAAHSWEETLKASEFKGQALRI